MASRTAEGKRATDLFLLLVRANGLQAWRRLMSIGDQSFLLTFLTIGFLAGYAGFSFWLFWKGLKFISRFPGLGGLLTERLLFLLFAFLFVLLWLSNLVISYTNLFRNRETFYLLSLPLPPRTIFQWKFLESTILASWAFLFLIAPLLAAYGMINQVVWHFYLVTPVLIALFIVLPAAGGATCAVYLANYLDRRSFQVVALASAAVLLACAALALKPAPVSDEMLETRVLDVLDHLLVRTSFAQFAWLPSYWLSASVLNWSEGALATAAFFALVLLSYVLFFGFLTVQALGNRFYSAISAVQSRGSMLGKWRRSTTIQPAQFTVGFMERVIGRFGWLDGEIRALVVKDARMFWRDTTQWGQTLVLFGLLGAYIINLRHFTQQLTNPFWIHLVSYLNLMACSLNLATLTTRFVYPQFSLEGKRLWILGIAPLGLERMIRAKFWFAFSTALVVTAGLILLSCQMLKMPWIRSLYFLAVITIMTFSLTGLAVGLGALYPNFKEDNPSKIVSGFGGTFCLVLSFVYIVASVGCLALGSPWGHLGEQSPIWIIAGSLAFIGWSIGLGWLPFHYGLRRVRRFEI